MGTILEFPSDTALSRLPRAPAPHATMGQVVILPVIRIERYDENNGGRDPEEGATAGRRRRRPARS